MSARTVRADYEALTQVGQQFSRQTDATRRTLQQLKRNMDVLQRGDWQGQGADKFYEEMNSAVLPSMQRLVNALDSAGHRTQDISRIMKEAEDEAANVLRGLGGVAPGSAAAFIRGDADGDGGGPSGGGSGSGDSDSNEMWDMLDQLDPKLKDNPPATLLAELHYLAKAGWSIEILGGKYSDSNTISGDGISGKQKLSIGSDLSADTQLHAVARARAEASIPPVNGKGMDKDEFRGAYLQRARQVEARRIFEEHKLMYELKTENTQNPDTTFAPDIPTGAAHGKAFDDVYKSYVDKGIIAGDPHDKSTFEAEAVDKMEGMLGNRWHFAKYDEANAHWDFYNAP